SNARRNASGRDGGPIAVARAAAPTSPRIFSRSSRLSSTEWALLSARSAGRSSGATARTALAPRASTVAILLSAAVPAQTRKESRSLIDRTAAAAHHSADRRGHGARSGLRRRLRCRRNLLDLRLHLVVRAGQGK